MGTENSTVLLVTADAARGAFLGDQFSADGFEVVEVDQGARAIRVLERTYPDVVVLDTALPDGPGLKVVAALRESDGITSRVDPSTPVIAITSSPDPHDRVRALERGADDVVTLPLHYPELLARTRGVLRRSQRRRKTGLVKVGGLTLDPVSRAVHLDDAPVELSQKEYALLQVLASEPTRVFAKEELLRGVWGFESAGRTRTLDSHACRLRQKLANGRTRFVVNVWGVGYRLIDGVGEVAPEPLPQLELLRPLGVAPDERLAA